MIKLLTPGVILATTLCIVSFTRGAASQTQDPRKSAEKRAAEECASLRAKAQNGTILTNEEKLRVGICARWDEEKMSPTYRAYIPKEILPDDRV